MYNRAVKKDYREIRESEKLAGMLLSRLSSAAKITEETEAELDYALQNYHLDQIEQILAEMDIEKISSVSSGLRIPLLKENGILTVGDLYNTSEKTLIDINGIGPDTAAKIMKNLNYIVRSISISLPVRITADQIGPRETRLLNAIRMKMHLESDGRKASDLYESHYRRLAENRQILSKAGSALKWFFTLSKTKKQITEAADAVTVTAEEIQPELERILNHKIEEENLSAEEAEADFRHNAPAYFAALESCTPSPGTDTVPDQIAAEVSSLSLNTAGLHAVLRHYQEFGAKFIIVRKKTLLADEMGLGKTVEAIAAAVHLKNEGKTHFLTVCPLGIIAGWQKELRRFSCFEPVLIRKNPQKQFDEWVKNGGYAVTNYETLLRLTLPEDLHIDLLTADEAHYVKNPEAKRTQALLRLASKADRICYMTGTPLENRPGELCYLISCLSPETGEEIRNILFLNEAEPFRLKIAPVYLRRKREDVLQELPELSRFDAWTDMTESEIAAYLKTVAEGNFMAMRRVSWNALESMKAARLLELCIQAKEDGRKTVIFSQFLDTIATVYEMLKDDCPIPITGSVPPEKRLEIIEQFSDDPDLHYLILQVTSGGIGQNIQAASVVIFCEPQIKPSLENQALSRVYRMGQLNHVFCYRLLSAGSIDERIIEILEEKQNAFDFYADESSVGESEMSAFHTGKLIEEERKKWNLLPPAHLSEAAETESGQSEINNS